MKNRTKNFTEKDEHNLIIDNYDNKNARNKTCGSIDELADTLRVARNYIDNMDISNYLVEIQGKLYKIYNNLISKSKKKLNHNISKEDIKSLENLVAEYMDKSGPIKGLVINGSTKSSVHLHFARTVCRNTERNIIYLSKEEYVDPLIKDYINGLANALYAFATFCEMKGISGNFKGRGNNLLA